MPVSLSSLSDRDILSRTQELVRRERSLTLSVLAHLNEIERRRLHLKQGYASMFEYCTTGLGYSESAAGRRIRTARCVARFPELLALLETGELNLSTICQVAGILTPENARVVIGRIRGRTQRQVEMVVAEYAPQATVPHDRVRAIVIPAATGNHSRSDSDGEQPREADRGQQVSEPVLRDPGTGAAAPVHDHSRSGSDCATSPDHSRSGSGPVGGCAVPASVAREHETRFLIQFSAGREFMAVVEKVRSLAAHRLPANATFEQVFALAMESMIQHEDPAKRREKRAQRDARRATGTGQVEESPAAGHRPPANGRPPIPARTRDEVFVRDRGRCTYVGANGRKCGSTHALQVDHVTPVARGGPSTPGNLRLLCAQHNRLEAERMMGTRPRGGPATSGP